MERDYTITEHVKYASMFIVGVAAFVVLGVAAGNGVLWLWSLV